MRSAHSDHKRIIVAMLAVAAPFVGHARPYTDGDPHRVQAQSHPARNSNNQHCFIDGGLLRYLDKLDLSESQQFRIFSIIYKQAQILNKQDKALRNAYIDLHKLAASGQYDGGRSEAMGESPDESPDESLARAKDDIALVRARGINRIYGELTTEQLDTLKMLQAGQPGDKRKCSFRQKNGSFGLLPFHIF